MHHGLLTNIVLLIGLAALVTALGQRLRVPGIVSLLLTGVLAGPRVLGLVPSSEEVSLLAEVGVIALLFTIGLEFSLGRLWEMRRVLLLGGATQVGLTTVAAMLWAWRSGHAPPTALFAGFLVALSSTAVVLSLLERRGEMQTPHGRASLAILLFQDIIVVPMMLLLPVLAGQGGMRVSEGVLLAGKILFLAAVVLVSVRWAVPFVLHRVARAREPQLFMITLVFLALGIAWFTASLGLSLALGAFLAGLIVSESEYSHRALGSILPLRDLFTNFFFISVGMLLDVDSVLRQPLTIAGMVLGVMALKALLAMGAVIALRLPVRTVVMTALGLCQVGEFSFVLYQSGMSAGLVNGHLASYFLPVAVVSLMLTPALMAVAPRLAEAAQRLPLPPWLRGMEVTPTSAETEELADHLVIIGYGFNGASLARVARAAGIPYTILEMNPDTVLDERRRGEPIHYGDCTQEAALRHVGVPTARTVVLAISDAAATRRTTELVQRLSPHCFLMVRTRFVGEIRELHELGADEVIPEEYETAIEIFSRVLHRHAVPRTQIEHLVEELRGGGYQALRPDTPAPAVPMDVLMEHVTRHPDITVGSLRLGPDSPLAGRNLAQAALRSEYGVTVLAVRRDPDAVLNPGPETVLQAGDTLIALGPEPALNRLATDGQLAWE